MMAEPVRLHLFGVHSGFSTLIAYKKKSIFAGTSLLLSGTRKCSAKYQTTSWIALLWRATTAPFTKTPAIRLVSPRALHVDLGVLIVAALLANGKRCISFAVAGAGTPNHRRRTLRVTYGAKLLRSLKKASQRWRVILALPLPNSACFALVIRFPQPNLS